MYILGPTKSEKWHCNILRTQLDNLNSSIKKNIYMTCDIQFHFSMMGLADVFVFRFDKFLLLLLLTQLLLSQALPLHCFIHKVQIVFPRQLTPLRSLDTLCSWVNKLKVGPTSSFTLNIVNIGTMIKYHVNNLQMDSHYP